LFLLIDVVVDIYASQCLQHRTLTAGTHILMNYSFLCFAAQDGILCCLRWYLILHKMPSWMAKVAMLQ